MSDYICKCGIFSYLDQHHLGHNRQRNAILRKDTPRAREEQLKEDEEAARAQTQHEIELARQLRYNFFYLGSQDIFKSSTFLSLGHSIPSLPFLSFQRVIPFSIFLSRFLFY